MIVRDCDQWGYPLRCSPFSLGEADLRGRGIELLVLWNGNSRRCFANGPFVELYMVEKLIMKVVDLQLDKNDLHQNRKGNGFYHDETASVPSTQADGN
jgi:hypothetical protein